MRRPDEVVEEDATEEIELEEYEEHGRYYA